MPAGVGVVTGVMVETGMVRSVPQPVSVLMSARSRARLASWGMRRRVRRAKASGMSRARRMVGGTGDWLGFGGDAAAAAVGATPVSAVMEMV